MLVVCLGVFNLKNCWFILSMFADCVNYCFSILISNNYFSKVSLILYIKIQCIYSVYLAQLPIESTWLEDADESVFEDVAQVFF